MCVCGAETLFAERVTKRGTPKIRWQTGYRKKESRVTSKSVSERTREEKDKIMKGNGRAELLVFIHDPSSVVYVNFLLKVLLATVVIVVFRCNS